jgi:hypothetical protein
VAREGLEGGDRRGKEKRTGKKSIFSNDRGMMNNSCALETVKPPINLGARTGGGVSGATGHHSGFLKEQRRQEMKKLVAVWVMTLAVIAFSFPAMAAESQPSDQSGNVIYGCYKKVNGQLRIVSAGEQCSPSEFPISWNMQSVQPAPSAPSPSGAVSTYTLSGSIGTIGGHASEFVFAGPTVIITTTGTQRITGVVQAPLGALVAGDASFEYDLCYRMLGTTSAPVNFSGTNDSAAGFNSTAGRFSFTAAASTVLGTGRWEVGFCIFNTSLINLDSNDNVNGWFMVTQ